MSAPLLTQDALATLPPGVAAPTYDRAGLRTGIVHVGVGNFHRAHQAVYLDRLLAEGASEWAICGLGLREGDARMRDVLAAQDGLYTLLTKHPDGTTEGRVVGSITDYVLATDDAEAAVARLAHPDTRIVSLTITEGGYNVVEATGALDVDHPDIQHELAHPDEPRTVYGFLAAALRQRRDAGAGPLTVMSCDNVQHNGDLTRRMLLAFAAHRDADLAEWIGREVTFPNTMVDRITPVTDPSDIRFVEETYGVRDAWPVPCEPFLQWIVEDRFCNGRPDLETVGVTFVPDVAPYEQMKLRLLNAGHSVVGLLGAVHGYDTIDACLADPAFATYLTRFLSREAAPPLDAVAGVDLEAYQETLVRRFGNPVIRDSVARICSFSSDKLPKFLLPTVRANLASGGSIDHAALVVAAWCYYSDRQTSKAGAPLDVRDPMADELHRAARETSDDVLAFVRLEAVFGDLSQSERFAERYAALVRQVYAASDVRECMAALA
ncbi:mannitol dehydrogenase family protein [Rubrivirga sp. S365]|uniref:mannitol dehydrogenase family protein n=1 Tax=Rubrivirga sp. S365 TaxID=3076080 RepID=UPI0028C6573D|nr:mannitol dehydrogenase family protein [Rubrivirga sp. S365]MDT7858382.1 mannitol dehydrogenase family protein [Rubrivirga sp. S365]